MDTWSTTCTFHRRHSEGGMCWGRGGGGATKNGKQSPPATSAMRTTHVPGLAPPVGFPHWTPSLDSTRALTGRHKVRLQSGEDQAGSRGLGDNWLFPPPSPRRHGPNRTRTSQKSAAVEQCRHARSQRPAQLRPLHQGRCWTLCPHTPYPHLVPVPCTAVRVEAYGKRGGLCGAPFPTCWSTSGCALWRRCGHGVRACRPSHHHRPRLHRL